MALAELGRWPLYVHWVQQMVRYWNRMFELEPDRLVASAFKDNVELMHEKVRMEGAGQAVGSPCWCLKWFRFLQSAPTDTGTLVWLTELDEEAVLARARAASTSGGRAWAETTVCSAHTARAAQAERESERENNMGALSGPPQQG